MTTSAIGSPRFTVIPGFTWTFTIRARNGGETPAFDSGVERTTAGASRSAISSGLPAFTQGVFAEEASAAGVAAGAVVTLSAAGAAGLPVQARSARRTSIRVVL